VILRLRHTTQLLLEQIKDMTQLSKELISLAVPPTHLDHTLLQGTALRSEGKGTGVGGQVEVTWDEAGKSIPDAAATGMYTCINMGLM